MKLFYYIFNLILVLSLSSCEDIGIIEEDLPYEHLYVIDGQISPGVEDPIINFRQSVPINEEFNISNSALTNVNAYIWSDIDGIFNLEHIGNGQYRASSLNINPNATYELFGDINGTRIYSLTKVPSTPDILEAQIIDNHIVCKISSKENEVYSCIYVVVRNFSTGNPSVTLRERDFFSVEGSSVKNRTVEIRTGTIPKEYLNPTADSKIALEVYAWDKSYKEYFETKNNNKPIDDVFSQGGGLIKWNVHGENTIGLFMGYATIVYQDF